MRSFVLLTTLFLVSTAMAETMTNQVAEWTFTASGAHADPFNQIELDAVFTTPAGAEVRVPAFWAGGKTWRVRYASPEPGEHRFRTVCSDATDSGLHEQEGKLTLKPYEGNNPLYRHGPIRVSENKRYFEHVDGKPFFWLGDTWWMGLTKRLRWPQDVQTLAADRKQKGFTLVQIVAGLYPDMPAFDERGANEAGFPWEKDYARIRPAYFDAADQRINYLVEQGLMPCIVSTWGFHLPWVGAERMQKHQRYVYARWGALPMVWCIAGELNLPFYTNPGFPAGGEPQAAAWEPVIRYCRSINGFGRLVTAHPSLPHPMSMRRAWKDQTLLDFDMLQTPHGQLEAVAPTVETVRSSYEARPIMPVVNAEPSYEMLFDRTPPEIARMMFWLSWGNGTGGYTYGANGIWQVNRRDQRYGQSPTGGDYGAIAWDEAMVLAGSRQVALAKPLLERFEWWRFEPHPEWATFDASGEVGPIAWGEWIWYPEGNPAADAPVAKRFFRKTFDLPADATATSGVLQLAVDDRFTAYVNGQNIGSHTGHTTPQRYNIQQHVRPGRNVIAVQAENAPADVPANPAGLLCAAEIVLTDGNTISVRSDATWKSSHEEPGDPAWTSADWDDAKWQSAKVLAPHGQAPWGEIRSDSPALPLAAAGVPGKVRIIYVPQSRPIRVQALERDVKWSGEYFDPATGKTAALADLKIADDGAARVTPPQGAQDWVLVLQAPQTK